MSAEPVEVSCEQHGLGWECRVFVGTAEEGEEHLVSVSRAELARLAPGEWEPTRLVQASFDFLLEREPRQSILRKFAISEIERYFPGFPVEIARRS
jgi:hypothetical protein